MYIFTTNIDIIISIYYFVLGFYSLISFYLEIQEYLQLLSDYVSFITQIYTNIVSSSSLCGFV